MKQILLIVVLLVMPMIAWGIAVVLEKPSLPPSEANLLLVLRGGSVLAAIVGPAMVVLITGAGLLARSNRYLLVVLFTPLLYLTLWVLVVLVPLHAALAFLSLYMVETMSVGRIHPFIIVGIGAAGVFGSLGMLRSVSSIAHKAKVEVLGTLLTEADAPELWQMVRGLAKRMGASPPHHIVAGLEASFFVTQAEVSCLEGRCIGRTLYVSVPESRILSNDEFQAVVGHELGHFKGLDTQFSQRFYPIYRGTVEAVEHLDDQMDNPLSSITMFPSFALMTFFMESFANAERRNSRSRELAADRQSAEQVGARAVASALVKLHAFSSCWVPVQQAISSAAFRRQPLPEAGLLFAQLAAERATPTMLLGIVDQRLAHPTDSHPPLGLRLEALGASVEEVAEDALQVNPESPATALFGDAAAVERKLTDLLARSVYS
jgi:Zn-dependent protease with chaperone function